MLRRLLIALGLLVAFLPYLGIPHSWQSVVSTVIGFLIVGALLLSRRKKAPRPEEDTFDRSEESKSLHVERMEIVERPEVHVERETIIDTAETQESPDTTTTVEQKVTVLRRRRKKQSETPSVVATPTLDIPDIPSSL